MIRTCICFLLLTLAVAIGVLSMDLHHNLRDSDAVLKHFDSVVSDVSVDYAIKAEQIEHIIYAARVTADQAGMLAIEQRAQLRKTSADSDKTVKALRVTIDRAGLLLKHTDEELNGETLPAITLGAADTFEAISANADAIGDSAKALTAQLNDPQIPALLGHFNTISGNLEIISGNSVAMSDDMRTAVHRLAQPPTKFHQFLDASYTTLKFGSLFIP